ncbi:MAG: hypothetical protein E6G21_02490 [Actinobacteria bacterium]|nr:MAG: hypothetical protein E6G21_02490 [Actinomycetota bacterium]
MEQAVAAPSAANRRRTSIIVTASIAVALVAVSIVFAASAPWYFVFKMLHVGAAVVWVGGGLFITICAVLAELADNDDQLLQIGHWAETVAGRLFPAMSFVVLGFGIAMTMNGDIPYNQFWIIFAAEHGPKAPEVQARLRRILFVVRVDVALMFLIVFDMVVKPFSWS